MWFTITSSLERQYIDYIWSGGLPTPLPLVGGIIELTATGDFSEPRANRILRNAEGPETLWPVLRHLLKKPPHRATIHPCRLPSDVSNDGSPA